MVEKVNGKRKRIIFGLFFQIFLTLIFFLWTGFIFTPHAGGVENQKENHGEHVRHAASASHNDDSLDDPMADVDKTGHDHDVAPPKLLPFEPAEPHPGLKQEDAEHGHNHAQISADAVNMGGVAEAGVDEKLGQKAFLDIEFLDENGSPVGLSQFVNKPTLLLPVYFHCPSACSTMMGSLSAALDKMPMTPGKEFRMVALSFDDEETVEWAKKTKLNHLNAVQKEFPRDEWRFLTGPKEKIDKVMDSIGYKYTKTGEHTFIHPNVLIVLAADGTIIRYLYGPSFLPFDIGMAVTEAEKGTPGVTIRKLLTYCFDYDPENKTYVFNAFRITAVSVLVVLILFFIFVLRKRS